MTQPHASISSRAVEQEEPALPEVRVEDALTLIIFGASGDLTARKLIPGLFVMYVQGLLPERFAIMGSARRDYDDSRFRELMADAIRTHSRVPVEEQDLTGFCRTLSYHKGDLTEPASYQALKAMLDDKNRFPPNRLFYLSVGPQYFEAVVSQLNANGMVGDHRALPWARVVIEKPFGRDLESAQALNRGILAQLDESQIYRIDHYLGKETVQNILSFRLANSIFEPLFNNRYVDHVQITAAETVGMESGRGGYYDSSGAIRDMVQNHLLQLLCLVAMEPPSGMNAVAIHNEKVKVLQCIQPFAPETVERQVVRAQYLGGSVNGDEVPGYTAEDRVPPDSRTETFVGLRLDVDNWRWAGVPFFLRTGKRMKRRMTEIAVEFKQPPLQLFQTVECEGDVCDLSGTKPNVLVFRIQPDEGISLHFSAKRPAMQFVVEGVDMDFSYAEAWNRSLPGAYERLLLDVMRGDSTLFTRSDEVEAAWAIIDPVLTAWAEHPEIPLFEYTAGSWGADEAVHLMYGQNATWRNE